MVQIKGKMIVDPPVSLKRPLVVPNKLLMGPGPSNCSPRVLHAMAQLGTGHLHPETIKIMDEIKEGLQYLFQTTNRLTLAVSASGHAGMEVTLCNILEPGEVVLIAKNGLWGDRAAEMAKRYRADVRVIETEIGTAFSNAEFEEALKQHRPVLLFVVHGESSTGVRQPLCGLGELCHKYSCLLGVDSVAALGGVPLHVDFAQIDILYTGSQKVIGAPPGLAPITFSPRAESKLFNRKTPVPVYYFDMTQVGRIWGCFGEEPRFYHHTVFVNLLYGLREALAELCEEGLESLWQRHDECCKYLHNGLAKLGLELFVENPDIRLTTVTAVKVPGPHWRDIIAHAMKTDLVEISGGLGPSAGRIMRIGIMGYNARIHNVERVLRALESAQIAQLKGKL